MPRMTSGPRRTTYAEAIKDRAEGIMEALGVVHYDACLERIEQIRTYCDHLEREIRAERDANPQHVAFWAARVGSLWPKSAAVDASQETGAA